MEHAAGSGAADPDSAVRDGAAQQAAELAAELSEAELSGAEGVAEADVGRGADIPGPGAAGSLAAPEWRRIAGRISAIARSGASRSVGRGTRAAGRGGRTVVGWLTGQVIAMGPKLRIRDRATLREQFPGRSDEDIADLLVDRAARAATAVGGATGAWAAVPVLAAYPAELAAETLAIVGIEIKLVAELHEVYGMPAPGGGADRARAYIASWAHRRGVYAIRGGMVLVVGSPLATQLRRRIAARVRRGTFSLAPLFTGAVAGALINRTETRRLGREIIADLKRGRLPGNGRHPGSRHPDSG